MEYASKVMTTQVLSNMDDIICETCHTKPNDLELCSLQGLRNLRTSKRSSCFGEKNVLKCRICDSSFTVEDVAVKICESQFGAEGSSESGVRASHKNGFWA
jgi:hypothetical protein